MKLRLPNKLIAAIMAAAAPVLFQTLSTATLGAAAVAVMVGEQAAAFDGPSDVTYTAVTLTSANMLLQPTVNTAYTLQNGYAQGVKENIDAEGLNVKLLGASDTSQVSVGVVNADSIWFARSRYLIGAAKQELDVFAQAGTVYVGGGQLWFSDNSNYTGAYALKNDFVLGTSTFSEGAYPALEKAALRISKSVEISGNTTFQEATKLAFQGNVGLTFSGAIDGSGDITTDRYSDSYTLTFSGDMSQYTGNINMSANTDKVNGTLVFRNNATGTGTVSSQSTVRFQDAVSRNSAITAATLVTRGSVAFNGKPDTASTITATAFTIENGSAKLGSGVSATLTNVTAGGTLTLESGAALTLNGTLALTEAQLRSFECVIANDAENGFGKELQYYVIKNLNAEGGLTKGSNFSFSGGSSYSVVQDSGNNVVFQMAADASLYSVLKDQTLNKIITDTSSPVYSSEASITTSIEKGATLTLDKASNGSVALLRDTVIVRNGGVLKLAQNDQLGWDNATNNRVSTLRVENGGAICLTTGHNETFRGALILNGSMTGTGRFDFYNDSSLTVEANETASSEAGVTWALRRDDVVFTVNNGATLNIYGNVNREQGNGKLTITGGTGVVNMYGNLNLSKGNAGNATLELTNSDTVNLYGGGSMKNIGLYGDNQTLVFGKKDTDSSQTYTVIYDLNFGNASSNNAHKIVQIGRGVTLNVGRDINDGWGLGQFNVDGILNVSGTYKIANAKTEYIFGSGTVNTTALQLGNSSSVHIGVAEMNVSGAANGSGNGSASVIYLHSGSTLNFNGTVDFTHHDSAPNVYVGAYDAPHNGTGSNQPAVMNFNGSTNKLRGLTVGAFGQVALAGTTSITTLAVRSGGQLSLTEDANVSVTNNIADNTTLKALMTAANDGTGTLTFKTNATGDTFTGEAQLQTSGVAYTQQVSSLNITGNLGLNNWRAPQTQGGYTIGAGQEMTVDGKVRVETAFDLRVQGNLTVTGQLQLGHTQSGDGHVYISDDAVVKLGGIGINNTNQNKTLEMTGGTLVFTEDGNVFSDTAAGDNSASFTISGGKLQATENSWAFNHDVTIGGVTVETGDEQTVTLGGAERNLTITDLITNKGNLVLSGNINVNRPLDTTAGTFSKGTYGYLEGVSMEIVANGDGASVNAAEGTTWTLDGKTAAEVGFTTSSFANGTLTMSGATGSGIAAGTWFMNSGEGGDFTYTGAPEQEDQQMTSILINAKTDAEGNTPTLHVETTGAPTTLTNITVNNTTANIEIAQNAQLNKGTLTTINNGSAVLTGKGVYKLGNGQQTLGDGISVHNTDWTGRVVLSGDIAYMRLDTNILGTLNSSIEFDGVTGFFGTNDKINTTVASNVIIGEGGILFNNGYTNGTTTFTGTLSGTGDMTRGSASTNVTKLAFQGDVSEYTGSFIHNRTHDDSGYEISFSGNAKKINANFKTGNDAAGNMAVTFGADDTVVNGIIDNRSGYQNHQKLNLVSDTNNVTFTNDVWANKLTINSGKTATFNAAEGKTQSIGSLAGSGTLKVTGTAATETEPAKGGLLIVTGASDNFTGGVTLGNTNMTAAADTVGLVVQNSTALSGSVVNFDSGSGWNDTTHASSLLAFRDAEGNAIDGTVAGLEGNRGHVVADTLTINVASGTQAFLNRYDGQYNRGTNTNDRAVLEVSKLVKTGAGTQEIGGEYTVAKGFTEEGLIISNGIEVQGGTLHLKTRGAVTADMTVSAGATLKTTDSQANAETSAAALQYNGGITLNGTAESTATLDYEDGSTYFTKGLTASGNVNIINRWAKQQYVKSLAGENVTLTIDRKMSDGDKGGYVNVMGTSETGFSGTIKLIARENNLGGGLVMHDAPTALANTVVDFSGATNAQGTINTYDALLAFIAGDGTFNSSNKLADTNTFTAGTVAGLVGTKGDVKAGALTINTANGGNYNYGGALHVSGVQKAGNGEQTLSAENLNLGSLTMQAGTLNLTHGATITGLTMSGTTTVNNGGTLSLSGTGVLTDMTSSGAADGFSDGANGFTAHFTSYDVITNTDGGTVNSTVTDWTVNGSALTGTMNTDGQLTVMDSKATDGIYHVNTAMTYSSALATADMGTATTFDVEAGVVMTAAGNLINGRAVSLADGATLKAFSAGYSYVNTQVGSLTLTGETGIVDVSDSNIALRGSGNDYPSTLNLNGHKLVVKGGNRLGLFNTTTDHTGIISVTNLKDTSSVQIGYGTSKNSTVDASGTLFEFAGGQLAFAGGAEATFKGLTMATAETTGYIIGADDGTGATLKLALGSGEYTYRGSLTAPGLNIITTGAGTQNFELTNNANLGKVKTEEGNMNFSGTAATVASGVELADGTSVTFGNGATITGATLDGTAALNFTGGNSTLTGAISAANTSTVALSNSAALSVTAENEAGVTLGTLNMQDTASLMLDGAHAMTVNSLSMSGGTLTQSGSGTLTATIDADSDTFNGNLVLANNSTTRGVLKVIANRSVDMTGDYNIGSWKDNDTHGLCLEVAAEKTVTMSGQGSGSGYFYKEGTGELILQNATFGGDVMYRSQGGTLTLVTTGEKTLGGLYLENGNINLSGGSYTIGGNDNEKGLFSGANGGLLSLENGANVTLSMANANWKFQIVASNDASKGVLLKSNSAFTLNTNHGETLVVCNNGTADATISASAKVDYTVGDTNVEIKNADVDFAKSESATLGNKLSNSTITNSGSGTLTVGNDANTLTAVHAHAGAITVQHADRSAETLKSIKATGGNILVELQRAAGLTVNELVLGDTHNVKVTTENVPAMLSADDSAPAPSAADLATNITVTGEQNAPALLQASGTTSVSTNLTVAGNTQMVYTDAPQGINMTNHSLTLSAEGGNIFITDAMMSTLSNTEHHLTLFTNVGGLTLNGVDFAEAMTQVRENLYITAASTYFGTGTAGAENPLGNQYTVAYNTATKEVFLAPEPTTTALSLLALSALAARRKRK